MNRALALLLAVLVCSSCAPGPYEGGLAAQIRDRYSGDRALETVAFLDGHVRWPGNPGFDASIDHVVARLESAGYVPEEDAGAADRLVYRVEEYPMDRPAWQPIAAIVTIEGESEPVLDFTTNRNMLATRSHSTPGRGVTAELVDVGDGSVDVDVAGRIVMGDANVGRMYREYVQRRGAVGVLGFAMPDYTRPEVNTTSIQFGSIPYEDEGSWGIALSFDARERLRDALSRGQRTVTVRTVVSWVVEAVERTVIAEIRGSDRPGERFVFSAHVQEPGANDNASGVGAQVEMARVAAGLVREGAVDPRRTITFLWGDEIRSTARFIEQDSARATGIRWGLSLDMVGEDTDVTGGTFLIEKMADPSAVWTRGDDRHTEWGGRPLSKDDLQPHYFNDLAIATAREQAAITGWTVATNPLEGGSDHMPFLRAGIPGLLFWHFTDQFYHTDLDRLDKVSPDELANVGITALRLALTLTTADASTARSVLSIVGEAAANRLDAETRLGRAALAEGAERDEQLDIIETWAQWYDAALASVADIEPGGPSPETSAAMAEARRALGERRMHALQALDSR